MGLFASCYDEKALTPTADGEGMLRYEYPQGTNSWNDDIDEIAKKYNVYLIYKNFKPADFNRTWTGGFTSMTNFAEDLTDEQAEFTTKFMKNHVFAYLNEKITPKVFPMYYYMAYDYHNMFRLEWGGIVLVESKTPLEDVYDGMDFWGVCLFYGDPDPENGSKIDTPVTKKDFFKRRGEILKTILLTSFDKGNIILPAGFENGFDYKEAILNGYGDEDKPNYYLRRGFPGRMAFFKSGLSALNSISDTNNGQNFKDYICFGLYYSNTELDKLYPRTEYPLLREKRDFVVNYLKTNYDIDLEVINEGPEIN